MSTAVKKCLPVAGTFAVNYNDVDGEASSVERGGRRPASSGGTCSQFYSRHNYNIKASMNNNSETSQLLPTPTGGNGTGSLMGLGLNNSLSVTSPVSKDVPSTQVGLRHIVGLGNQIDKHKLKAEELRKLSKGALRNAVTSTSKRWFVLYDDSHNPIGDGGPVENQDYPVSPATHHEIIIDSTGTPVSAHIDQPYYIPSHLEYHDNEKKWRAGGVPNKDIVLKECFNICRKLDGVGMKVPAIAVCTLKDTLDIIFEKEQDMLIWLEALLSCQHGGRSAQGRIARPTYENMWEISVKVFKPDKGSTSKFFQMTGPHRLVATEDAFKFFELGSYEPKTFPWKDIKGHGKVNRYYHIQTGRMTLSGRGEIELDCKDQAVAAQIYATFERLTKENYRDHQPDKKSGHHGHHRQTSTSSSRSSRSRDSVQGHGKILPAATSQAVTAVGGYRPRSESWSNPSVSHSLTDSKHGVLPGHPCSKNVSTAGGGNEGEQSLWNTSGAGPPKQSVFANVHLKKDLRQRTTSEGNQFENLPSFKYRRGGKSSHFISGSPLSPGSYISSESAQESAGSSNSIDDSDVTDGHKHATVLSMTPNADHPPAATIFEESSAESWVDPCDPISIEEQIIKENHEAGKAANERQKSSDEPFKERSEQHQCNINVMKRQQGMSSLINGPYTTPPSRLLIKESSVELGQFALGMDTCSSPSLNKMTEGQNVDVEKGLSANLSYAELCLEQNNSDYPETTTTTCPGDFLPGSHPALVGMPIPRNQHPYKRGHGVGGESLVMDVGGLASSPSTTHYTAIMNVNDLSSLPLSTHQPTLFNLGNSTSSKTISSDLIIATSPSVPAAAAQSDYMLMSPPPPTAMASVPSVCSSNLSSVTNTNQNISTLVTTTSTYATHNYSGSSSSTSSLKRQTSIGTGGGGNANCGNGVRSNISTLERERRRLSMLGLDETQINSMLMTSSLTGSVSNPRDASSSLITSPSSQSSYNPLSDGGGIEREDMTGAEEEDSVYTLMSPTAVSVPTTSFVPIPGSSPQNVTTGFTCHPYQQQPNWYSGNDSDTSLNHKGGRGSVGSNYNDAVKHQRQASLEGDRFLQLAKSPSAQQILETRGSSNGNEEEDTYVNMSPAVISASSSTLKKSNLSNSLNSNYLRTSISNNNNNNNKNSATTNNEYDTSQIAPLIEQQNQPTSCSTTTSKAENADEPTPQFGSRRGSKASLSHLSSSPSAALTSHLSGQLLPLYTDIPHSSSGPDQLDHSSPYLLMSPVNVEEKLIVKEGNDSSSCNLTTSSIPPRLGNPSNPIYTGTRPKHRNRKTNNDGSKRSSLCSDNNDTTTTSNTIGWSPGSHTNVGTSDWIGPFVGSSDGKSGSVHSSLAGTPVGSFHSHHIPPSSLHHYKGEYSTEALAEYQDDVYVPLSFGDDDAAGNLAMPLQDHELPSSSPLGGSIGSSITGTIQIPTKYGGGYQHRTGGVGAKVSPVSSSSLISGTPNSCGVGDKFPTSSTRSDRANIPQDDHAVDEIGKDMSDTTSDGQTSSFIHNRTYSLSSQNRPSTVSTSNSSLTGILGSSGSSKHGKSVDVPSGKATSGKSTATTSQLGTSPNSMASRLGSWFRSRAGSVPARPPLSGGRRHRTTSEGEKTTTESSSKLPENEQMA